jgi:hypothetical protein
VPTFLVASWIYAIDPRLLDVSSSTQSLAIVQLSVLALIAGFGLWPRRRPESGSRFVGLVAAEPNLRVLTAWSVAGFVGLAIVLAAGGGPIHYLRNLNREGSLTQGKTYFIVLALSLVFAAQIAICMRWSRGLPTGRLGGAGLLVALALVAVLGARLFIAVGLAELALFFGLTRRRPPVARLVVPVVVIGAVLILGIGAVKRFSDYRSSHPGTSLVHYLSSVAPHELPTAYANNYADGVRLIALSRVTVPRYADYEYGKELLRLVLQPLPHGIRPVVKPAPGLKAALYPGNGFSYALPLQAVSYVQFGLLGVALGFALFGAIVAELDYRLAVLIRVRPSSLMLFAAVVVELLATLRDADAPALAVAIASIVLLYAVARTSERVSASLAPPSGVAIGEVGPPGRSL